MINFLPDNIYLSKGEIMGFMQCQTLDVSEIITESSTEPSSVLLDEDNDTGESEIEHKIEVPLGPNEKEFITSPTDIDVHKKVDMQDAEMQKNIKKHLRNYVMNTNTSFQ